MDVNVVFKMPTLLCNDEFCYSCYKELAFLVQYLPLSALILTLQTVFSSLDTGSRVSFFPSMVWIEKISTATKTMFVTFRSLRRSSKSWMLKMLNFIWISLCWEFSSSPYASLPTLSSGTKSEQRGKEKANALIH